MSRLPQDGRQKALFEIKLQLSDDLCVYTDVFNYDTPITVCDRALKQLVPINGKQVPLSTVFSSKNLRRALHAMIDQSVNGQIEQLERLVSAEQVMKKKA